MVSSNRLRRLKQLGAPVVMYTVSIAVMTAVVFVFVEGMSSLTLFGVQLWQRGMVAERKHTQFDPLLGWINVPNLHHANEYGPNIYMKTNSRSFRNDHEVQVSVPPGKVRLICSGDSFTLGWGVSNDKAWCNRLATKDERIEAVNMGQGGYGLDQAYLWYKRDGFPLDHHFLLFAFIDSDFERMASSTFEGRAKPFLILRDGKLEVANYPLSRPWLPNLWLPARTAEQLRSLTLLRTLFPRSDAADASSEAVLAVAEKIFEELRAMQETKRSELALVYLPYRRTYRLGESDRIGTFVRRLASSKGYRLIDVAAEFDKVEPSQIDTLFNGHYSEAGNALVAEIIFRSLFSGGVSVARSSAGQ